MKSKPLSSIPESLAPAARYKDSLVHTQTGTQNMKLATLKNGTRDGRLVVVSNDLRKAVAAEGIAGTMQHALDNWKYCEPMLRELHDRLNAGSAANAITF